MFIRHQIQPESQTQRQNNDPGHPQSLYKRTPRNLSTAGNPPRLACISNLRDAQTNNRDRAQYSAPRRPRIPSYISTMSNNCATGPVRTRAIPSLFGISLFGRSIGSRAVAIPQYSDTTFVRQWRRRRRCVFFVQARCVPGVCPVRNYPTASRDPAVRRSSPPASPRRSRPWAGPAAHPSDRDSASPGTRDAATGRSAPDRHRA